MNSPGMSRIPKVPSLLRRIGFSFLLGFGLFVLGAVLQRLMEARGIHGTTIYVDDLVLGTIAGLVVFAYEQRRSRDMSKKLAVISAMNHHVRNALQTLSYLPYADQAKQILLVQQSVNRIQWAMQEILPGEAMTSPILPPASAREHKKKLEGKSQTGT
jgi:hypothetical protein